MLELHGLQEGHTMPELRRGVRRGRAPLARKRSEPPVARNYVKTRAAVARERARGGGKLGAGEPATRKKARRGRAGVASKREGEAVVEEGDKEEVEVKAMGDESGGLSANKAGGQEEEGSTAPFPERVCVSLSAPFFVFQFLGSALWS